MVRLGPGDLLYASMTPLAGNISAGIIQDLSAISSIRYLTGESSAMNGYFYQTLNAL